MLKRSKTLFLGLAAANPKARNEKSFGTIEVKLEEGIM